MFPGRRLLVAGSGGGGLEVWAHPWRIAHGMEARIDGASLQLDRERLSTALVERSFAHPGGTANERCSVSVGFAAMVWELRATPDADVEVGWLADLAPAGGAGDAPPEATGTGGVVRLARAGGPLVEVRLVAGDVVEAVAAGPCVRVRARGRGTLRLAILAGGDAADLRRIVDRFERRGCDAVSSERGQHARLLADYATGLETGDAADGDRVEWAKFAADGLLIESPVGRRWFAAGYHEPGSAEWAASGPVRQAGARTAASLAAALLAAGIREPVRDALRTAADDARLLAAMADPARAWTGEPPGDAATVAAHRRADAEGVWHPLTSELLERWQLAPTNGSALALAPELGDRDAMALRRVRVGASVLDVELFRRFDRTVVRLHRRHGPVLPVALTLPGPPPISVSADDQPLPAGRVVVAASDRHEVVYQY